MAHVEGPPRALALGGDVPPAGFLPAVQDDHVAMPAGEGEHALAHAADAIVAPSAVGALPGRRCRIPCMILQRIDHVGYAVESLEEAIRYHERLYGAEVAHRERMDSDGVDEALLAIGDSYIQLLQPTRDDSPVARFLERNGGPGVHHIGYGVADIDATFRALSEQGVRLVEDHPRPGSRGCTVAFIHPKAAMGVLVELVEDPTLVDAAARTPAHPEG
jgi:methylmalonyl-CoA/ethylmalonyl-CoA epimerase